MYAYITDKRSTRKYPDGWVGIYNGVIIYDRPLTDDEIRDNMFIQTATPMDSPEAERLYDKLSKVQAISLPQILGGILNDVD